METKLQNLLRIDHSSVENIEKSFERISKELFNNYSLKINDLTFHFTELEFYYFYKGVHEDNNTHKHELSFGRWRCHDSGIDITLESNVLKKTDPEFYGGILIRGLKQVSTRTYINGPIRIKFHFFNCLKDVMNSNSGIYIDPCPHQVNREIYKTTRQGIIKPSYLDSKYRFFTELDNWDKKMVPLYHRKNIENNKDPNPII